jgi:hypothetical protein
LRLRGKGAGLNAEILEVNADGAIVRPYPDPGGGVQWFHFDVEGHRRPKNFTVKGLDDSFFPAAFRHGQVAVLREDRTWGLLQGVWDGTQLTFSDQDGGGRAFAAWAAYSPARLCSKIVDAVKHGWTTRMLCHDAGGTPVWALGAPWNDRAAPPVVCLAAQHPGERVTLWTVEALLRARHCDRLPPLWIVPCVNPDGLCRGHARKDCAGVDLNRSWHISERSPAIAAIVTLIRSVRPQIVIDLHGDELSNQAYVVVPVGKIIDGSVTAMHSHRFADIWNASCSIAGPRPGGSQAGDDDVGISTNMISSQLGIPAVMLELPHLMNHANVTEPYAHTVKEVSQALISCIRKFSDCH